MASRQQMEWMLIGAMLADEDRRNDAACEAFADAECRRISEAIARKVTNVLECQFKEIFAAKEPGEPIIDTAFRLLRNTAKTKRFLDAVGVFQKHGAAFLTHDQTQMLLAELHQWEARVEA